jgi:hypothetical protein
MKLNSNKTFVTPYFNPSHFEEVNMPNYPDIHNLMLKPCCTDAINRINNRIKLGNILRVGIGVGAWVNIFGPSPSKINTIVSVK